MWGLMLVARLEGGNAPFIANKSLADIIYVSLCNHRPSWRVNSPAVQATASK